jgi:N-acetylglucosamine-6-phosphate deacetylase
VIDAGVPLLDAVRAGATTPAALIGIGAETGSLVAGSRADVLVVDASFEPVQVIRGGRAIEEVS